MKSFMYHYIRNGDADLPWFRYLHMNNFKRQLDFFQERYDFVSIDAWKNAVQNKKIIPNAAILTFDDGLKDHYLVAKELKSRGLWGIFYISTGCYDRKQLLDVHRIHILIGKYGGAYILSKLEALISEGMVQDKYIDKFHNVTYTRQDNDEATKQVKQLLNYFISKEEKLTVLDKLMEELFEDEASLCEEYYLSHKEIEEMHEMGMVIGAHSVTHPVLSKLECHEQEEEIIGSFNYLEKIVGTFKMKTFCYPYGGDHSFNKDSLEILDKGNALFSFSVEQRDISSDDFKNHLQALPRYDCNQFPYGKASIGACEPERYNNDTKTK